MIVLFLLSPLAMALGAEATVVGDMPHYCATGQTFPR